VLRNLLYLYVNDLLKFMKKINKRSIEYFQENILEWFEINGRNFPWRKHGISNYKIIISEVLLQRTKAETIAKFYPTFLNKYPSWKSINKSRLSTLEKALIPIGLYRQRSVLLKDLAKEMVKFNGRLPKTKEEIQKLPFAGQYITNAILQYIYHKPAPLLDINMDRVLERYFGPRKLSDIRYDPYLQDLAWKVVKNKDAKKINWGILDFAALICKSHDPLCFGCKLRNSCRYVKLTL